MNQLIFTNPTLITLTAPTCSGKSFLLAELARMGCPRIVSTTTRDPRPGEEEGVDYNFISRLESQVLEDEGAFAELVTYNGVRYGVTHQEMKNKVVAGKPAPVVILTPHGIEIYEKYCASRGWDTFKIFVYTQQSLCLDRLARRTAGEVAAIATGCRHASSEALYRVMTNHTSRVLAITRDEAHWQSQASWDLLVPGDDLMKATTDIVAGVKLRNTRVARLNQ
jgi:guanylate kinase